VLTRRLESLFLSYAVKIWRKRAALLGGVPSLDVRGSKLVLSHLLNDGRCGWCPLLANSLIVCIRDASFGF